MDDGWIYGLVDGWMDGFTINKVCRFIGWMNGRVDGWMDGWMNEWMHSKLQNCYLNWNTRK